MHLHPLLSRPVSALRTPPSACWFNRVGLLHWKSPINLLMSSFPAEPVVESETRFKRNMESLKVILV